MPMVWTVAPGTHDDETVIDDGRTEYSWQEVADAYASMTDEELGIEPDVVIVRDDERRLAS